MSRKLLTIRFNGGRYHGWQVQNNAITVQKVLQDALEQLYSVRPDVTGCSRTDAGVHAEMYCLHYDEPKEIIDDGILLGLNRYLPDDISAFSVETVSDDFHARYRVKSKTYVYRFYTSRFRNPFCHETTYFYGRSIDTEKAEAFCKSILGTHDFIGFSASGRTTEDTVRTIYSAEIKVKDDVTEFYVTADGFLYNMVRILAGTIIDISNGKIIVSDLPQIIDSKDRSLAGFTAPPNGLSLYKVTY